MKVTSKELLALGPGASAAWHGWRAMRGDTAWKFGSIELIAVGEVEERCYRLLNELDCETLVFDGDQERKHEVALSAFEARVVAGEMATLARLMRADYTALSSVEPSLRPERLCLEDVEDLRERLLAEADRLDAEAASVSDS